VSTPALVASTVVARYCILVTAGLLQLAAALAIGMPLPRHPLDLFIVFTFVSFAFIGLGLVMAMMADNVPAVQALGQCIFLPMLIIGGIAVPLASLPDWAQHLSAFFPGRYAVQALQACVVGIGLSATRFDLLALVIIGAGGCIAGAKMFRWDAQQRFSARSGKAWVSVALLSWAIVGGLSEYRGRIAATPAPGPQPQTQATTTPAPAGPSTPPVEGPAGAPSSPLPSSAAITLSEAEKRAEARVPARERTPSPSPGPSSSTSSSQRSAPAAPPSSNPPPAEKPAAAPPPQIIKPNWQAVTLEDIDRDLIFDRLPADEGIVTPIAPDEEEPDTEVGEHLQYIREMLPSWQPGKVADPVQRVRNILYVAAVPDVLQMPIERFAPLAVFDQIREDIPKDQLFKILYWIALHPSDGEDKAVDQLWALKFPNGPVDIEQTRERAALYAVKLLGRVLGKLPRPRS